MLNLTLDDDGLNLDDGGGGAESPFDLTTETVQLDPDPAFADVDIEAEAEGEIETALEAFKRKASREEQRMLDAVDSEFYAVFCFQNRAQKEEFLRALNLLDLGNKYLDGMAVAQRLAIDLETPFEGMPIRTIDSKLTGLAPDFGEPYPA